MKAIIVDDEQRAIDSLTALLKTFTPQLEIISSYTDPIKALSTVKVNEPDVLFLDIEMPTLTGLKTLEYLEDSSTKTVFVTAHNHHTIEAIRLKAYDYLLKPVDPDDLLALWDRLQDDHKRQINAVPRTSVSRIALPTLSGNRIVDLEEIVRLKSDNNYTQVILKQEKPILVSRTLGKFEQSLPPEQFIRVHQSHMVNFNLILEINRSNGGYLVMTNGDEVPLNNKNKAFIKKALSYGLISI